MRWVAGSRRCGPWPGVFLGAVVTAASAAADGLPYPRLANIYLHGAVDPADIPRLARWDVLVLDSVWSHEQLRALRDLNPDIKLFFYVCAYCLRVPPAPTDAWRRVNYEYARDYDLWWRNADGSIASDWPNTRMVNITERGPRGPMGSWRQFLTLRLRWLIATRPELDGFYFDNFWQAISWQQGRTVQLDSDCSPTHNPAGCDGVMDTAAELDSLWNRALRRLARDVRATLDELEPQLGRRPRVLMANGASDYFEWLNGTAYEYFPSGHTRPDAGNPHGYNWTHEMLAYPNGYLVAPFRPRPYRVQILNAMWRHGTRQSPQRSPEFERHKRFTFVSALLGDGYYSLDAGVAGHGNLWWEPEFDHGGRRKGYLGHPKGQMQRLGTSSGDEIVLNGSFSHAVQPWQILVHDAAATLSVDAVRTHSPPGSARIDVASVRPGGSVRMHQRARLLGGYGLTLSFWGRATPPQILTVQLRAPECPESRCAPDRGILLTNEWEQHEVAFVGQANAGLDLSLQIRAPGSIWIDDVSLRLGETAVYRRDFEHGVALLNYTRIPQLVALDGVYRRLDIPGSDVSDGQLVREETVPPWDGRILLREPPPTDAREFPEPRPRLGANAPNPFNPKTRIPFVLGSDARVRIDVLDLAGRRVTTLLDARRDAGAHAIVWDGRDARGRRAPSGVYVLHMSTPRGDDSRTITLVR